MIVNMLRISGRSVPKHIELPRLRQLRHVCKCAAETTGHVRARDEQHRRWSRLV